MNDLGVVDSAQVHGGDPEIGVTELALDDDQRHALARHLDGVRMPRLMWRRTPASLAGSSPAARMTAMISSAVGGSGG